MTQRPHPVILLTPLLLWRTPWRVCWKHEAFPLSVLHDCLLLGAEDLGRLHLTIVVDEFMGIKADLAMCFGCLASIIELGCHFRLPGYLLV